MLPCLLKTPADSEKYAKASYVWRDQHGKGMLKARATVFGNGSLYLRHLQSRDTDTYYCDVFLPEDTSDTIIHNVIGIAAHAHRRQLRIPCGQGISLFIYPACECTRREIPKRV